MADYITKIPGKEILGQAYSHLEIDFFHDEIQRENLERIIKTYVEPRAKFLFGEDIDVVVDFEEGSLKSTITIWGLVGSLITGVAQYKPLKEGASEIVKDVKTLAAEIWASDEKAAEAKKNLKDSAEDASRLAQATNLEVLFNTGARSCKKIRLEKRTGVVGRASHLIRVLDGIKNDFNLIDKKEEINNGFLVVSLNNRIKSFRNELNQNLEKIEDHDGKVCLAAVIYRDLIAIDDNQPALEFLKEKIKDFSVGKDLDDDEKELISTYENLDSFLNELNSLKDFLNEFFPRNEGVVLV